MKLCGWKRILVCCLAMASMQVTATAHAEEFSFGVISHPVKASTAETQLREAIKVSDEANLAFVVIGGLKAADEPCSDLLYNRRKSLFHGAKNGIVLSIAANDWAECKYNGKSTAISRLNRLRELFFGDEFSLGETRISLVRESTSVKFRGYGENARWEVGDFMFATINLPDNNNHYLAEAGRNSEFEDRLIANRDWLHRIFVFAALRKSAGIVIFCDGNPFAKPKPGVRRDGFAEIRQQILARAAKFPGKVLIVHGENGPHTGKPPHITWQGRLGVLEFHAPWLKVHVDSLQPELFFPEQDASPPTKTTGSN